MFSIYFPIWKTVFNTLFVVFDGYVRLILSKCMYFLSLLLDVCLWKFICLTISYDLYFNALICNWAKPVEHCKYTKIKQMKYQTWFYVWRKYVVLFQKYHHWLYNRHYKFNNIIRLLCSLFLKLPPSLQNQIFVHSLLERLSIFFAMT